MNIASYTISHVNIEVNKFCYFSLGISQDIVSVQPVLEIDIPRTYHLFQNYPNPFNSNTKIEYQLPKSGEVHIRVFDILGNKIRTLIYQNQDAGKYHVIWNGRDENGYEVTSGYYIIHMQCNNFINSKKILLLK